MNFAVHRVVFLVPLPGLLDRAFKQRRVLQTLKLSHDLFLQLLTLRMWNVDNMELGGGNKPVSTEWRRIQQNVNL